jgi:phytoene synthase
MAFQIDRTRALYRRAEPGISLLHPTSRDCVGTALRLYKRILVEIERADFDVFTGRAQVSRSHRLAVAGPGLARAMLARGRLKPARLG